VHLEVRIIGGRVLDHRNLVAKLSGISNSYFETGVCYQSHDDQLMNTVSLELQIQIRVGEASGSPMLVSDDIARSGLELGADLATPGAVFESFA
jgi:hypothetical protein